MAQIDSPQKYAGAVNSASNNSYQNVLSSQTEQNNLLISPAQPWALNGFFKVHLDHYLYITADFNMVPPPSVNSTTSHSAKTEPLIHFSQDRRVITGEVHYFDHPYIGMVVQIRRFDPTKPEEEAVTQSIAN